MIARIYAMPCLCNDRKFMLGVRDHKFAYHVSHYVRADTNIKVPRRLETTNLVFQPSTYNNGDIALMSYSVDHTWSSPSSSSEEYDNEASTDMFQIRKSFSPTFNPDALFEYDAHDILRLIKYERTGFIMLQTVLEEDEERYMVSGQVYFPQL